MFKTKGQKTVVEIGRKCLLCFVSNFHLHLTSRRHRRRYRWPEVGVGDIMGSITPFCSGFHGGITKTRQSTTGHENLAMLVITVRGQRVLNVCGSVSPLLTWLPQRLVQRRKVNSGRGTLKITFSSALQLQEGFCRCFSGGSIVAAGIDDDHRLC